MKKWIYIYDDANPIHCHLVSTYAANKMAEKAANLSTVVATAEK
jgi:hypothetical protein